ncbi:MAG: hypothetical protein ABIH35_04295 [Patescibacteria group bacterium]
MPEKPTNAEITFSSSLKKAAVAVWDFLKSVGRGLLIILERFFGILIKFLFAIAKIVQALALAILAITVAAFLTVAAFYLLAKATDLSASPKFQEFREQVLEISLQSAFEKLTEVTTE